MSLPVRIAHRLRLAVNPFSVGVRALVEDEAGAILLVRHTYVAGWHFPGGGVDAHETAAQAAMRELREETGVELLSPPQLVGVYLNRRLAGRDHVLLFRGGPFRQGPVPGGLEIAEARFFSPSDLPGGLSQGTRRRLAELSGQSEPDGDW